MSPLAMLMSDFRSITGQAVYDKRTATQKKLQAMEFARSCRLQAESREGLAGSASHTSPVDGNQAFQPGHFVSLVEESSQLNRPKFLIGRVLFYVGRDEVCLLWYKNVKGNLYKAHYDGDQWIEPTNALNSVSLEPSRKFADQYKLLTCPRSIHKKVFSD